MHDRHHEQRISIGMAIDQVRHSGRQTRVREFSREVLTYDRFRQPLKRNFGAQAVNQQILFQGF